MGFFDDIGDFFKDLEDTVKGKKTNSQAQAEAEAAIAARKLKNQQIADTRAKIIEAAKDADMRRGRRALAFNGVASDSGFGQSVVNPVATYAAPFGRTQLGR